MPVRMTLLPKTIKMRLSFLYAKPQVWQADMKKQSKTNEVVNRAMVTRLIALAPEEGYNLSPLPDVRFLRSDRPLAETPVLYEPGIVVVCQGRKRGYFADQVYVYDAQHYLAVSVPVPFTMEMDASEREPFLAVYFSLDFVLVAELLLQLEENAAPALVDAQTMFATQMDERMSTSVLRFLDAMADPLEARVLGRTLVKEIYYRVLTGEQGGSMRAALANEGRFGKVFKAIRKIHTAYSEKLDVDQLADEAGMSAPSFHAHFKNVTATSPMQYLKSTRLHRARLLMARNGLTAAVASAQVGYESTSQFSREFKRLFGLTPLEEVARMKQAFALPDADPDALFVSSH